MFLTYANRDALNLGINHVYQLVGFALRRVLPPFLMATGLMLQRLVLFRVNILKECTTLCVLKGYTPRDVQQRAPIQRIHENLSCWAGQLPTAHVSTYPTYRASQFSAHWRLAQLLLSYRKTPAILNYPVRTKSPRFETYVLGGHQALS